MQEQRPAGGPDYQKYAGLQVHEPQGWLHLLSKSHGCELAIISITAITIFSLFKGELPMPAQLLSISTIFVLGLARAFGSRETDATSSTKSIEDQIKPGHTRRDQATA